LSKINKKPFFPTEQSSHLLFFPQNPLTKLIAERPKLSSSYLLLLFTRNRKSTHNDEHRFHFLPIFLGYYKNRTIKKSDSVSFETNENLHYGFERFSSYSRNLSESPNFIEKMSGLFTMY